jgi:hypothetical protein
LHDGILFGNLGQFAGFDFAGLDNKVFISDRDMRHLHFVFRDSKQDFIKEDIDQVGPIGKVFLFGLSTPLVGTQQENFFFAEAQVAKGLFDGLDLIGRNHLHPLL